MMKIWWLSLFVACVLLISFAFSSSDSNEIKELTEFYKKMVIHHSRMDPNIEDNSVLFFGDSITQELNVIAIAPKAINFGIGGDTTAGLLQRIGRYRSMENAKSVVITIGVNDLDFRGDNDIVENYRELLDILPEGPYIVFNAILPVDESKGNYQGYNERITFLNKEIESLCGQHNKCTFVTVNDQLLDEDGNLSEYFHVGDGIHLNAAGYSIWIDKLSQVINHQG